MLTGRCFSVVVLYIFIYLTINTYYEIGTVEHEGTHMIMVVKNDIFYVNILLKLKSHSQFSLFSLIVNHPVLYRGTFPVQDDISVTLFSVPVLYAGHMLH